MIERLRDICTQYGLGVRFDDLGSWGDEAELRAEYDPEIPEIVVNRCLTAHSIARAIAHELYHHREAIGEITRLPRRVERERAAERHAAALIEKLQ